MSQSDTAMYAEQARESLKDAAQARLHEAAAYLDNGDQATDQCIAEAKDIIEIWRQQE